MLFAIPQAFSRPLSSPLHLHLWYGGGHGLNPAVSDMKWCYFGSVVIEIDAFWKRCSNNFETCINDIRAFYRKLK